MKRYRHKQHPDHVVSAYQAADPKDVPHGSKHDVGGVQVAAEQLNREPGVREGHLRAMPGDWVVSGPNEQGVFSDAAFTAAYEEI